MRPSLRPHEPSWSRSSRQLPLELCHASVHRCRPRKRRSRLCRRPRPDPRRQIKAQGIAVGQAAAATILGLRAGDGAVGPFLNFACPQDTDPGEYQCTPGTPFIAFEGWADVIPFVLKHSSQFRPGPPYAVDRKKYTADFNEVKSLGGDGITTPSARTVDETEIALYWWESSPLKWNRIARTVSADQGLDSVGERPALRAAQHGACGRLHRHGRFQEPLQLLAAGHRDSGRGHGRQSGHRSVTRRGPRCARLLRTRTTPRVTRSKEARLLKC